MPRRSRDNRRRRRSPLPYVDIDEIEVHLLRDEHGHPVTIAVLHLPLEGQNPLQHYVSVTPTGTIFGCLPSRKVHSVLDKVCHRVHGTGNANPSISYIFKTEPRVNPLDDNAEDPNPDIHFSLTVQDIMAVGLPIIKQLLGARDVAPIMYPRA